MPSRKSLLTASIIFVLLITGAGLGVYSTRFYRTSTPPEAIQGLLWPNPKQLGEFSAINQNGDTFNISNLQGHWSLLFFGYTHCPDVCPVTLSVLEQVQTRLQQEQPYLPFRLSLLQLIRNAIRQHVSQNISATTRETLVPSGVPSNKLTA